MQSWVWRDVVCVWLYLVGVSCLRSVHLERWLQWWRYIAAKCWQGCRSFVLVIPFGSIAFSFFFLMFCYDQIASTVLLPVWLILLSMRLMLNNPSVFTYPHWIYLRHICASPMLLCIGYWEWPGLVVVQYLWHLWHLILLIPMLPQAFCWKNWRRAHVSLWLGTTSPGIVIVILASQDLVHFVNSYWNWLFVLK